MQDPPSILAEEDEGQLAPPAQVAWQYLPAVRRALAQLSADGRTEKWVVQKPIAATVADALTQLGACMNGTQFKAPALQVVVASHQCLAPKAKSRQAWES